MKYFLRILPYILILILSSLLVVKCQNENTLESALIASNSETNFYKNELGTVTASRDVIEVTNSDLKKVIAKQDEDLAKLLAEFKKVKATVIIRTEVQFDTIYTSYTEDVPFAFIRTGNVTEQWYSLNYKVTEKGLTIAPFTTWTDLTIITGTKRNWFLGKQRYVTDVTASNPNIKINAIQSISVTAPVKWYETTVFKVGIGFIGGVLIKN